MVNLEKEFKVQSRPDAASQTVKMSVSMPAETVTPTNTLDVQVDITPAPQYSESQLGFQRLLLREHKHESRPGEGLKRAGVNASIFLGATAADLAESHLVDWMFRDKLKHKAEVASDGYHKQHDEFHQAVQDGEEVFRAKYTGMIEKLDELNFADAQEKVEHEIINKLHDAAKLKKGTHLAAEFAEEWFSDGLYASAANNWVRLMTGENGAKYVSETSAFVADWANIFSQVFKGDKLLPRSDRTIENMGTKFEEPKRGWLGVKLAYQTMDFINPVNVEATFRLIEEVPVIGDGFAWLHEKSDKLLESAVGRWTSGLAGKGILGYHIGRNVVTV